VDFDKKQIDAGILMFTSARSEKSSLGTSRDLAVARSRRSIQPYPCRSPLHYSTWGRRSFPMGKKGREVKAWHIRPTAEGEQLRKLNREREDSASPGQIPTQSIEFESPVADPRR